MNASNRHRWLVAAIWVLGLGCVGLPRASSADVLVRYRSWSDGVAMSDRTIDIALYADGTVRVHRPAWMREPGDFELKLGADEAAAIAKRLDLARIAHVDPVRLASSVAADDAAQRTLRGEVYEASESVVSTFDFALTPTDVRIVTVENLQLDAERKPQLPDLVDLSRAEQLMRAWLYHPGLKPVNVPVAGEAQP